MTPDSVLVLQNIGPAGHPGMPEAGLIPIPRKLAAQGVQDMLRLSDGRMSGTAGGTIVGYVSPEAADPESLLGIARDGDLITCDAQGRMLNIAITDEEVKRRMEEKKAGDQKLENEDGTTQAWVSRKTARGYRGLYMRSVTRADQGADFDFLTAAGPEINACNEPFSGEEAKEQRGNGKGK